MIAKLVQARRIIVPRVFQTLLWALAIVGACYLLSLILPWEAFSALAERTSASDQASLAGAVLTAGAQQQPAAGASPAGEAASTGDELAPAAPPSGSGGAGGASTEPEDRPEDNPDSEGAGDAAANPAGEGGGSTAAPDDSESAAPPAPPAGQEDSSDPPAGEPADPEAQAPSGEPAASGSKQVALTFDDGPDTRYTPQVLEILQQYGVQASFFVVGTQIEKYPDVLKQIHDEGHTIGSHTYGHANLTKLEGPALLDEIEKGDALIQEVLGESSRYFRAPYGAVSDPLRAVLQETGRELVGWTVDTRDWAGTAPEEILQIVKDTVKPGGIILMHSFGGRKGNLQNTIDALPAVIEYLQEEGYTLVPMPELSRS
ncbi:polysaccharide deacetylase family protein [Paenibacillus sp. 1P07SE]|uniref:polysaccharide deacetylase family protein n=1 Tax=Paenibacillus sp. 1P07SE TaxID=3132209 RepID=UPI0039A67985